MSQDYRIAYLVDHPEHIDACAAWSYGRWGATVPGASFSRAKDRFTAGAQENDTPLTIIAIDTKTNCPIAMGSIWDKDGDEWPDLTPWIAAVFVHHRYRDQSLARAIIKELETAAKALGHKQIHLHSGSAAPMYEKLGYTAIETKINTDNAAGTSTLFTKKL